MDRKFEYCFIKYTRGYVNGDGCFSRNLHGFNIVGTNAYILVESFLNDWAVSEMVEKGYARKTVAEHVYILQEDQFRIDSNVNITDNTPEEFIPLVNGIIDKLGCKYIDYGTMITYDYKLNAAEGTIVCIDLDFLHNDNYEYLKSEAYSDAGLYEYEDTLFKDYCEYEYYQLSWGHYSDISASEYSVLDDISIANIDDAYYAINGDREVTYLGDKNDADIYILELNGDSEARDKRVNLKFLQETCIPMFA